jgi:dihydrofolate reductase
LCAQFGGPLKERTNLVVSRQAAVAGAAGTAGTVLTAGTARDGALWFPTLGAALEHARVVERRGAQAAGLEPEVFVLGGAEIFAAALTTLRPAPDRLVVTWVPEVPSEPGDTFFPFRPPEAWILREHEAAKRWRSEDGQLEFVVYDRRNRPSAAG